MTTTKLIRAFYMLLGALDLFIIANTVKTVLMRRGGQ